MNFEGLFTMLNPGTGESAIQNGSKPYYYDATWGYGIRTQITGTFDINTSTGRGSATIAPFEFFNGGPAVNSDIQIQAIGNGLLLGNFNFGWNGSDVHHTNCFRRLGAIRGTK